MKSGVRGDATYYYSIPRLAATGRIVRNGQAVAVKGLAWLDREWGSGGLAASEAGWDWFGLQLIDGANFMFYALRDRSGGRDPHSAGTWVDPAGKSRELSSDEVQIEVTRHWTSPHGVSYPCGWHIRVPTLALDAEVTPVMSGQAARYHPALLGGRGGCEWGACRTASRGSGLRRAGGLRRTALRAGHSIS